MRPALNASFVGLLFAALLAGCAGVTPLPAPDADPAIQAENEEWEIDSHTRLNQALESLDPRSRDILASRWMDGDSKATLHDLAGKYGVSAERIRQLEANAIRKLRGVMVETA